MNIPQTPKDITDAKQMQDYMTGIQKALTQKQIDDAKLSQDKTNITDSLDAKITAVGDGIIESGSNTNGKWIKFRDGTMICLGVASLAGTGIGVRTVLVSFPLQFYGIPSSFCNTDWGQVNYGVNTDHYDRTDLTVRLQSYCSTAGAGGYQAYWYSIGRWK